MRYNSLGLFVGLSIIVLGCSDDERTSHVSIEDQVRESAFRFLFDHNHSALQKAAFGYYLGVNSYDDSAKANYTPLNDPSPELMSSFSGFTPVVKRLSDCELTDRVRDKVTKERGLIFRLGRMNWINGNEVDVDGGYYEGNMSAAGYRLRIERRQFGWEVMKDRMLWIM